MRRSKGEVGGGGRGLRTHGSFLALVPGLALAAGQPTLQLLGKMLVAVLTHWLQVHLHKLVPARPKRVEEGKADKHGGKKVWENK